jgi:hypothetical protein
MVTNDVTHILYISAGIMAVDEDVLNLNQEPRSEFNVWMMAERKREEEAMGFRDDFLSAPTLSTDVFLCM